MPTVENESEMYSLLWFWPEWVMLVIAWLFAYLSFLFNYQLMDGAELFSRSGSAVVVIAVYVEFRLRKLRDNQLSYAERGLVRKGDDWTRDQFRPKVRLGQRIATYAAHTTVVMGTVVWGYGDLLYCNFNI